MVTAVVLSAVATLVIAVAYVIQIDVMRGQLDTMQGTLSLMKENQRIALRPMLKMQLHEFIEKGSWVDYEITEEGGERWMLPYYIRNIGTMPAWKLSYWHKTVTDSVIIIPEKDDFQIRWSDDLIFPAGVLSCGYDILLRQVFYDEIKTGKKYYRHFMIKYSDEFGNNYAYYAVWVIRYIKNQPLAFASVSYRPVPTE